MSYKVAVVTSSGLQSSQTTGYGTQPTNYVTSIDYGSYSKMGCTNSQIKVTKSSGTFNSGNIVNDKTPNSSTSSGNNAVMAFPLGFTNKALTATTQYNPYIFITYDRVLDTLSGADHICLGTPQTYTYGGEINDGDELYWYLLSSDGNTQYDSYNVVAASGSTNTFTIDPEALGINTGSYLVKFEIKTPCCGLSVPIWKDVTVAAEPTGVLALSGTSPICSG